MGALIRIRFPPPTIIYDGGHPRGGESCDGNARKHLRGCPRHSRSVSAGIKPAETRPANDQARQHGAERLLARYQAHLFFPMLLLEAISLHVASVRALSRSTYRERGLEALLLGLHFVAYLTAVVLVLSPLRALVFVVVQQGLFGLYLGCAFAPNHKGMPILTEDDDADFLRRQVLTSRNVRGGWLVDFTLGGLNYQIEHHLFPSMPRASLRHARPIVRAHCLQHGLPYIETSRFDSNRQALHHLHTVGRSGQPVRESEPPAGLIATEGRQAPARETVTAMNATTSTTFDSRVAAAAVPAPAFPSLSAPSVAFLTQTRRTPASDRNSLANSEENAVATSPTFTAQSSTPQGGATARARRHERVKRAIRRRAGRIRVLLLVLALLLPLLVTTLLGGR